MNKQKQAGPIRIWFVLVPLIVFGLTRLAGSWWPLSWPDEALFSSPAAALATTGHFITPVLIDLIPDMQTATLWNSPLYMIILAGIYSISGESLLVARWLSFGISIGCLGIFWSIVRLFRISDKTGLFFILILCLDLSFLRAANTARMDMLTLFWVLVTTFMLIKEHQDFYENFQAAIDLKGLLWAQIPPKSRLLFWGAGLCTGLAAMSHPIAILLVPVWLLLVMPRLKPLLYALLGFIPGIAPWLIYILRFPEIFWTQFSMQLQRKQSIFELFGGETGGAFKVFFSQYGEGLTLMILALVYFTISILISGWILFFSRDLIRKQRWSGLYPRMFLIFAAILTIIILSSEGWYALYATPFLLILLMSQWDLHQKAKRRTNSIVYFNIFIFSSMILFFYGREFWVLKKSAAIPIRHSKTIAATSACKTVYLRIRPDPYFALRAVYPKKRILEFIPGKLVLPAKSADLTNTFDSIDCFFLNDEMDWEPQLKNYLHNHNSRFMKHHLEDPPLERATLWKRKNA